MSEKQCCGERYREKEREGERVQALSARLNRIIGQLNGIKIMIENNRYCGDILVQVGAAESALRSFGYEVLEEHMHTCVSDKIKSGDCEVVGETMDLIRRIK